MRINKFVAQASGMSRRKADQYIISGQVEINKIIAQVGDQVNTNDEVLLRGKRLLLPTKYTVLLLNKPVGYVSSRVGQGHKTVYDILPEKYANLKLIGRLDKNSSGLILLTNNGELANKLTHPSFAKEKVYEIELNKALTSQDETKITSGQVELEDGVSKLVLKPLLNNRLNWQIKMSEGRNRQIRRTFEKLNYSVNKLHRTNFGEYSLANLPSGEFREIA